MAKPRETRNSPRHGVPIARYARVGSTIEVARSLVLKGEVGTRGVLVVAEAQTRGQGTRGRDWQSPKGSLAATLIVPGMTPMPGLGLWVGLASADAVTDELRALGVSAHPRLRWPNDLVFEVAGAWRKVGGCLTLVDRGESTTVLASVGINVNNATPGLGEGLRTPAVSLREVAGRTIDLASLTDRIADGLAEALGARSSASLVARGESMLAGLGDVVAVQDAEGVREGIALGLTSEGGLRLRCAHQGDIVVAHGQTLEA